jgi:hypothetical protein
MRPSVVSRAVLSLALTVGVYPHASHAQDTVVPTVGEGPTSSTRSMGAAAGALAQAGEPPPSAAGMSAGPQSVAPLAPQRPVEPELGPPGYRETIEHALSEFSQRHFDEARAMFLRAHELYPNARTLRGLGLAEFEQRRYVESLGHLEAALASAVRPLDGELRADTEELAQTARSYVSRINLTVRPSEASAALDGSPVTLGRGPLLMNPGEHTLLLTASGYRRHERRLVALGGETQDLLVSLDRERVTSQREQARPLRKNPWLWTGIGAVVAGAITATVLATRGKSSDGPHGGTSEVVIPGPDQ